MNWAHVHLLLNHLPVVGTIFGVLLLVVALLRKSEELKRLSLGVFVFTALLALPVYLTGEPAEKVVEHLPGVTESLIERHENVALIALLVAGVTGMVGLIGLVLLRRMRKLPAWLVGAALILSLATGGLMGWTANLGGLVRHTEIRSDVKAPAETETEGKKKIEKDEEHD